MLSRISPEELIPAGRPIRRIKPLAEAVLRDLEPTFGTMYAQIGRPSIPPEHLLKSCPLIALYSMRSGGSTASGYATTCCSLTDQSGMSGLLEGWSRPGEEHPGGRGRGSGVAEGAGSRGKPAKLEFDSDRGPGQLNGGEFGFVEGAVGAQTSRRRPASTP